MSLHFTLAKKLLAHAKDLLKHIFNEAGEDAKSMEKEFLEAIKSQAHDQLTKFEEEAGSSLRGSLQPWEKAPRPEDATSPNAPADMSWDEKGEDAETSPTEAEGDAASASPEPSEKPADGEKADGEAAGESGAEKPKEDESPASGVQTYPAGEQVQHGDPDAAKFEPAKQEPVTDTAGLPTEGASGVHGDALPSSGIQSAEAAAKDPAPASVAAKEGQVASDEVAPTVPTPLEEPKEEAKDGAKEPAEGAPAAQEAPAESSSSPAELGGQDESVAEENKATQEEVPALNGGLDVDDKKKAD
jgi:hypothetical protein